MNVARVAHTATRLRDGRVLIAGGISCCVTTPTTVSQFVVETAEIYDPETDSFTPTGSMAMARGDHTATLLRDSRVLIVGIGNESLTSPTSAEIYDPETGVFTSAGNIQVARAGHAATALTDGRVLVTGGSMPDSNGSVGIGVTEIFDPARGWTAGPVLQPAWVDSTATLVGNGELLIFGGTRLTGVRTRPCCCSSERLGAYFAAAFESAASCAFFGASSAPRRGTPTTMFRTLLYLGDTGFDQLADEQRWQWFGRIEVKRTLGPFISLQSSPDRPERGTAEREVGAPFRGRAESGDHLAVESKRRNPVTDALLGIGNDLANRLAEPVERSALLAGHGCEVLVDRRRLSLHAFSTTSRSSPPTSPAPHPASSSAASDAPRTGSGTAALSIGSCSLGSGSACHAWFQVELRDEEQHLRAARPGAKSDRYGRRIAGRIGLRADQMDAKSVWPYCSTTRRRDIAQPTP
jgi:hypothetical protein